MCPQTSGSPYPASAEEAQIEKLYLSMIEGWNQRDAQKLAAAFDDDGMIIGCDGTHHSGAQEIEESIARIFRDHATPPFLIKVKSIRMLTADVAQLEALVGMIPPGKEELDPKLHAFQVMTAVRRTRRWTIKHLQNTPAQLHSQPGALDALSHELLADKLNNFS
ncbi:MAG TPA: SgcJ/EcaC family oxidoreductase [Oligoflexus sp.]|uniref:SgcJ/EcaC family oxidoreductase n=1 Tax=Oligoflexus sp. TaxID=1971216 RepID=UPI002D7E40B6|nr:SgcJ/EcaC family oxidoreductase [Oligoflexus sp.]HET9241458.1 SgcJ/EcaC family oxidoreductase [Oligoflexus sp.]